MNIGFIGLGKLGLPCALGIESKGHSVWGYDVSPAVEEIIKTKKLPYKEIWAQDYLNKSNIQFTTIAEVVKNSEIIFVPIQTPHDKQFEGTTRLPATRVDFDYSYLKAGIKSVADEIAKQEESKVVIIISTVLPGTIDREIKPLLNEKTLLCYNPFFIAMGTTMKDFLDPEYVLFGVDSLEAATKAENFYRTLHDKLFYKTTIKSAELIKVAYNTFIGMKIVFINTMMEICHKTGANVDAVTDALLLCTNRVISGKYLRAGMGDGGGCHPRDNIALSWLARELNLSHDFFSDLMTAREDQTSWLVDLIEKYARQKNPDGCPTNIYILGKSFKSETNITTGSPAILLHNLLKERGWHHTIAYDPHVDEASPRFDVGVYLIGTKHPEFVDFDFPAGSVIIDPWRYIPDQENITVIRIGEGKE